VAVLVLIHSSFQLVCVEFSPLSFMNLMVADAWDTLHKKLTNGGFDLIPVNDNLIDLVWDEQPPRPSNLVITQPLKWTGNLFLNGVASFMSSAFHY
jgi:hypothetical protein